ncbi:protein fam69b-like [Plakobranchus ocellatus]|uniref:Protein fam69b-like n=1 Tax=Plakobranchus ocellatus TaxID=259542 RepID=A0AAV4DN39_9GAST|nr:protein fam69b-like [Plakobranchus ocellatus]
MWNYDPYLEPGAGHLFDRSGPGWAMGFFSNSSYRWSLPSWTKRAKVMMGLLELVTEFYDRDGGRFYLCNMDGMTLHHNKHFELSLTESSLPLSATQISTALKNITCYSWRDCAFTPQCTTLCNYKTHTCLPRLVRPTLSHACHVMTDYLLFDAPARLKPTLGRLLRRCQKLTWSMSELDLHHSLLSLELRDIIWGHIQNAAR